MYPSPRSVAVLAALLLAPPRAAPRKPAAPKAPAVTRPSSAVQALLDRASKEPLSEARTTLEQAEKTAEGARDTAGLKAAAALWEKRGAGALSEGDLAAAGELWEQARRIREKHAPGSPELAQSLRRLGEIAYQKGDMPTGRPLLERALEMEQKAAPGSAAVAAVLESLADLEDEEGRFEEAVARRKEAVRLLEATHAPPARTVQSLQALARLLDEGGRAKEADPYFERAADLGAALKQEPAAVPSLETSRPQVRFLFPGPGSRIRGGTVPVTIAFWSAGPAARLRLWLNGRPLAGEQVEVGESAGKGPAGLVVQQRRALKKGADRAALMKALPGQAELSRSPAYDHFQQVRLPVSFEAAAGPHLRIAALVETATGKSSEREILRLERRAEGAK